MTTCFISFLRWYGHTEKEISVEDMQKIVDANEKLIKELKDGTNTISKQEVSDYLR